MSFHLGVDSWLIEYCRSRFLRGASRGPQQHGPTQTSSDDLCVQDERLRQSRRVSQPSLFSRQTPVLTIRSYCNRIYKTQESQPSFPLSSPTPPSTTTSSTLTPPPTSSATLPPATTEPEKPSIYHTLLALYLTPPPDQTTPGSGTKPLLGPALELLSKHGSRLPATSALALVPDSLPVAQLESYFRGRMRAANSAVNETRVVAGLRRTALFKSQAALFLGEETGTPGTGAQARRGGVQGMGMGRNRRVVIAEERVCGVCHKRIGGSVVAVLRDNAVVHYGCLNKAVGGGGGARPMSSPGSGSGMTSLGSSPVVTGPMVGSWGRTG